MFNIHQGSYRVPLFMSLKHRNIKEHYYECYASYAFGGKYRAYSTNRCNWCKRSYPAWYERADYPRFCDRCPSEIRTLDWSHHKPGDPDEIPF